MQDELFGRKRIRLFKGKGFSDMLDQRRAAIPIDKQREQIFLERYDRLLVWAMHLTRQRELAEDLVQDAFVQFMLGRSQLSEIRNIDAYLSRMLRYIHVSQMTGLAQQRHEVANYGDDDESSRFVLTELDADRRMQVAQELYQICFYACQRKNSSRVGSVLILRFFHNYSAAEVAKVTNSSRHCVYELQRLARREARQFISSPGVRAVPQILRSGVRGRYLSSDGDLIIELREMIFRSTKGGCLALEDLTGLYSQQRGRPVTTSNLAHIVSCPPCLDAVNNHLELPTLAEREEAPNSYIDFRTTNRI